LFVFKVLFRLIEALLIGLEVGLCYNTYSELQGEVVVGSSDVSRELGHESLDGRFLRVARLHTYMKVEN